ncbi:hypothetical protein PTKIN_Ptkin03bG0166800 [Pterospermum kingtungense]
MRGLSTNTSKGALDRALCDVEWKILFLFAKVLHLARAQSDHLPLLIRLKDEINVVNFGFKQCGLLTKLFNLWHLQARIAGVQRCLAVNHTQRLIKLEVKLKKKIDTILKQEELLWYQKSMEDWICSGDLNTKYYHALTMVRQSRNRIDAIRGNDGNWVMEVELFKGMVQHYFQDLFFGTDDCDLNLAYKGFFPVLEEEDWSTLHSHFASEEVKKALFDMPSFKTSGLGGVYAGFYLKL